MPLYYFLRQCVLAFFASVKSVFKKCVGSSNVTTRNRTGTVAVSGLGEASSLPDMCILSAEVEVVRATAKSAVATHNTSVNSLLSMARSWGIPQTDI
ncbi:SIMPL domain-containing protein, partial [Streptomyces albireticuli]|uniref:SIMPL domain-containing protein n=1 Tax=Streptomyces albireticuli TaxID=1940 RepID=UPI003558E9B4